MKNRVKRTRLDTLLVERRLAESRQKAQAMILAGEVDVNGAAAEKAGMPVGQDAIIDVHSRLQRYASRGGLKLEGALQDFSMDPAGRVCLDIGASTGGFTDCLLQYGATKVYDVDVNAAQLAWKLKQDPRVLPIQCNARELKSSDIPEKADLVVIDVSFISVTKILRSVSGAAKPGADFLILVKPQFELQRKDVGPGGIVREPQLHERAIASVRQAAEDSGLLCLGVQPSHLPGAEGNQEYFLHARKRA